MTVSNVGPAATPLPPLQPDPALAKAPPIKKNDHDSDDGVAAASAAPPKGQGTQIDTKA
jgi:hypothetical protein